MTTWRGCDWCRSVCARTTSSVKQWILLPLVGLHGCSRPNPYPNGSQLKCPRRKEINKPPGDPSASSEKLGLKGLIACGVSEFVTDDEGKYCGVRRSRQGSMVNEIKGRDLGRSILREIKTCDPGYNQEEKGNDRNRNLW